MATHNYDKEQDLVFDFPQFSEEVAQMIREDQAAIKEKLEKKYPGVYKLTVGVVDVLAELEEFIEESPKDNYPPHTIKVRHNVADNEITVSEYEITMAVAGFSKEDLEVEIYNNTIFVSGNPKKKSYLTSKEVVVEGASALQMERIAYSGIAARSFKREFLILESMTIRSVILDNGTLTITIENPLGARPSWNRYEIVEATSDIPILYIDKAEPNPTYPGAEIVSVYCDECLKYHTHGMPKGNDGKYVPEHRNPHCKNPHGKYSKKGYMIAYKRIVD